MIAGLWEVLEAALLALVACAVAAKVAMSVVDLFVEQERHQAETQAARRRIHHLHANLLTELVHLEQRMLAWQESAPEKLAAAASDAQAAFGSIEALHERFPATLDQQANRSLATARRCLALYSQLVREARIVHDASDPTLVSSHQLSASAAQEAFRRELKAYGNSFKATPTIIVEEVEQSQSLVA